MNQVSKSSNSYLASKDRFKSLGSPRLIKVILITYCTLLLLGLCDNLRGPLYPEILKTFPVGDFYGSFFFSLSSVMGIIGAYGSRFFIGRFKELNSLRISILTFFVGLILMAAAQHFVSLLLGILFFGFSMGLMGVVQNMLLVNEVPQGPLKSKVISGLHSMYAGSSLAAPIIVSLISAWTTGVEVWRAGFLTAAGIAFVIFLLTFKVFNYELAKENIIDNTHSSISTDAHEFKHQNEQNGQKKIDEMRKNDGPSLDQAHSLASPHPMQNFIHSKNTQIYFGCILASYVLAEILVSSRIAQYIRREFEGSLNDSNLYTGLFFVCLLVSRIIFSIWGPQISIQKQLRWSLLTSIVSVAIGIYLHPLGLALSGFFMGPFYPLMILEIGHVFSQQVKEAISWAVTLQSAFIVGMHFIVGIVSDLLGVKYSFYLGPIFLALAFLLLKLTPFSSDAWLVPEKKTTDVP